MIIKCLAIDDEPVALEKLKTYIGRIPYFELAGVCEGTHEATNFIGETDVDAIFIDINMPDVNGLDFIRTLSDPPLVVFTTAHAEYAVESYKVRAVDYLLKPYGFEDFQRASANLYRQFRLLDRNKEKDSSVCRSESGILYLKVDYRYVRVSLDDITYIEGMNEYLKVHLSDGSSLLTHTTFRLINECLPSNFLQVHRSYVVNMNKIKEVERAVILMSDGARISVSESNRDSFMQYLQSHSIRKQ